MTTRSRPWWLALALAIGTACTGASPGVAPSVDASADDTAGDAPAPTDASDARAPADAPPPSDNGADDVAPPTCPTGQTACGGVCVDTRSSNANCATCGNACPAGQSCRGGACVTETMCSAGQMRCGEACVDTSASDTNCGACGNACPAGQRCAAGACGVPTACPSGQTSCGGACVDTSADANNCGACGNGCPMGQVCMAGSCRPSATCTGSQTSCGGLCVNTGADANNCGACGNACPAGQVCMAGVCRTLTCPEGQSLCGSACVSLTGDATNCGACGRACASGQSCASGACTGMTTCPTGQIRCGDACADVNTDPANCGMCGHLCAVGQSCQVGACGAARPPCFGAQTDCAPTSVTPACVDTQTSNANCGACGHACPAGQSCASGVCMCAAGQTLCGRGCVNTASDVANCGRCSNACLAGQTCASGACGCGPAQTLCGGACVNTASDRANCGRCGAACPAGQTCTSGVCACATGATLCGGACVNTASDRANCGRCGAACAMGQACSGGACACPAGQVACAGVCVDTRTSAANCGSCGNACPTGVACMSGGCRGVPPGNDVRAGATLVDLSAPSATVTADTSAARHDTSGLCGCTTAGNDVFFRLVLTAPEVVYADTLGATWDTSLFLQDARGNNLVATAGAVTCNDDAGGAGFCPGLTGVQSMIAARLGAGTYYLVLSGCGAGVAQVHVQHLPAGSGSSARITPTSSVQTATGSTAAGTGTVSSGCCSGSTEDSYFWVTCPGADATSFQAASCDGLGMSTAAYDIELAQYSALRAVGSLPVCNDDVGGTCGTGSSLSATIPPTGASQAGLDVLVVDGCSGAGAYAVSYVLASCVSGTRCGGACVNTATDPNNCGGCDRRCSAGGVCVSGVCYAPPSNDRPAGAVTIDLSRASSTYFVNTYAASNDTTGPCGCTSGRDVFYNFTLTAPELVYADTVGSSFDTSLFVQLRAGGALPVFTLPPGSSTPYVTACNDDGGLSGCGAGLQSQVMTYLPAGDYRLVVSGCGTGNATLHVHHLPVGNGALRFLGAGSSVVAGLTAGVGRVTSACCSGGPEDTFYWYTCPAFAGATFSASTCGRATWDTELDQRSTARATPGVSVCNDDACGTPLPRQSSVTSMVPAGAGLHALYVDGCGAGAGAYTASVARP